MFLLRKEGRMECMGVGNQACILGRRVEREDIEVEREGSRAEREDIEVEREGSTVEESSLL